MKASLQAGKPDSIRMQANAPFRPIAELSWPDWANANLPTLKFIPALTIRKEKLRQDTRAMPQFLTRLAESHRHRRALDAVARQVVGDSHYDDFQYSPVAAAKLRELHRKGVKLALAAFAYDALRTAESIVELFDRGEIPEALSEKRALIGRVIGDWAWQKVGLYPRPDLFELATPLGLGLGAEFKDWLFREGPSPQELVSWLTEYGPQIERFVERAKGKTQT